MHVTMIITIDYEQPAEAWSEDDVDYLVERIRDRCVRVGNIQNPKICRISLADGIMCDPHIPSRASQ